MSKVNLSVIAALVLCSAQAIAEPTQNGSFFASCVDRPHLTAYTLALDAHGNGIIQMVGKNGIVASIANAYVSRSKKNKKTVSFEATFQLGQINVAPGALPWQVGPTHRLDLEVDEENLAKSSASFNGSPSIELICSKKNPTSE